MTIRILSLSVSLFLAGFVHAGEGWSNDYEAARKAAAETGKPILIDFTGSDWCGWCIKLDDEVFSKKAFKSFAEENLVLMVADFPRGKELSAETKKQNEALAEKFGIRGFPTILLVSPEGELIGKTGYRQGGAEAYVAHLEELIGKKPADAQPEA